MSVMREEIPPMEGGRGTSNPGDTGKPGVIGVDAALESAMAGYQVFPTYYISDYKNAERPFMMRF
jgi:hypothetical protein